jgi:hypothetical protein
LRYTNITLFESALLELLETSVSTLDGNGWVSAAYFFEHAATFSMIYPIHCIAKPRRKSEENQINIDGYATSLGTR